MKFHENISNSSKAINPKVCNPESWLCNCLMVLNICVKFHENISNDFDVTERTRVCSSNGNFHCSKSNNSKSMQSKVVVPVLCTSSHESWCLTFV